MRDDPERLKHCCLYEPDCKYVIERLDYSYIDRAECCYVRRKSESNDWNFMSQYKIVDEPFRLFGVGFLPVSICAYLLETDLHIESKSSLGSNAPSGFGFPRMLNKYLALRKAKRAFNALDRWQCSDGKVVKVDSPHSYRPLETRRERLADCRIWKGNSLSQGSGDTYLDIFESAERAYVSGRCQTVRLMAQFESELGEPTADVDYALLLCMFEECKKSLADAFSAAEFSAALSRYEALPRNDE